VLVVFKADAAKSHKLEHWNQELVLIPDIQVVQGPQGVIPSFVGLHDIKYDLRDLGIDLLLFESTRQGGYKSVPRIANRKASPLRGNASTFQNSSVVKKIEGASQVGERVSDHKSDYLGGKIGEVVINPEMIYPAFDIFLDSESVKVRVNEVYEQRVKVVDVLLGPLNLEV
jgi:hypothetical protein